MVLFKINGERNSGTIFFTRILKKNNFPCCDHIEKGNICTYWKHGYPSDDQKNLDEQTVDIFLFRNLDDWLISMFRNPYELNPESWNNNFGLFLNAKQVPKSIWKNYKNEPISIDDKGKTVFEIRYNKFNKIMEYKKRNKDVILVNLSFIQKENNLEEFLNFLTDKYIPKLKVNNYSLSIKHTKDGSNNKNRSREININEYKDIINSNKNEEIENFINNLTFIQS